MTITRTLGVALLAALALLLTACGGNDDDAQASKSLSASIRKSASGGPAELVSFNRKEADCIGDGLVKKIGTDRLQKYGVLDKNLEADKRITEVTMSAADAREATGVLFDCTDVEKKVHKAISSTGNVPTRMRSCIDKTLDEQTLRGVFTQIFQGQSPQKVLTAPITKCALGSKG